MSLNYPWLTKQAQQIAEEIYNGRHAHAYLFHGPSGVGKAHLASELSRAAVCESAADDSMACGQCRSCLLSEDGNHPDIKYVQVETGATQITVDESRDLIEFYTLKSHYGVRKTSVILDSDKLNRNAANALLKMVEEPPTEAVIFLTTSKIANLPLTLRSR